MEYITRQKIYDCRFWKERCFGLTAVDVLEGAAQSLTCIGGTFGGNQQPTKFLCFTLKLLQLQPDDDLVQEFIQQDHFKYVRALGVFYLRLTGRPADIYEQLDPLYADFSKLKVRCVTEWKLLYMDEFITELLNPVGGGCNASQNSIGIALPRLPLRETLQDAGYLPEGPRPSVLRQVVEDAGGLEEYLHYKALQEQSPAAMVLWGTRNKHDHHQANKEKDNNKDSIPISNRSGSSSSSSSRTTLNPPTRNTKDPGDDEEEEQGELVSVNDVHDHQSSGPLPYGSDESDDDDRRPLSGVHGRSRDDTGSKDDSRDRKRQRLAEQPAASYGEVQEDAKPNKKQKKKPNYGTLFADKKQKRNPTKRKGGDVASQPPPAKQQQPPQGAEEGTDQYWNEQRAKLGLKPLRP
jgi:pre-mRNA-splicing factor 38A